MANLRHANARVVGLSFRTFGTAEVAHLQAFLSDGRIYRARFWYDEDGRLDIGPIEKWVEDPDL